MSIISERFGVRLLEGLGQVDDSAAMRTNRRDYFEGGASPDARMPRLRSLAEGAKGDEPLSVARCNKLADQSRSKPS